MNENQEEMVKKVEAEWREAWKKDDAGHVLTVVQEISGEINSLQEQIYMYHPEEQMNRMLGMMAQRMDEIEKQLVSLSEKPKEPKHKPVGFAKK